MCLSTSGGGVGNRKLTSGHRFRRGGGFRCCSAGVVIGRYRLHGNCLAFRYAYRQVFAHATSGKAIISEGKRCSNPSRVRSFLGEAVIKRSRENQRLETSEKTGQGIMFARVENSCKKKENSCKKRVFLLDKRLEMWYNIYSVNR